MREKFELCRPFSHAVPWAHLRDQHLITAGRKEFGDLGEIAGKGPATDLEPAVPSSPWTKTMAQRNFGTIMGYGLVLNMDERAGREPKHPLWVTAPPLRLFGVRRGAQKGHATTGYQEEPVTLTFTPSSFTAHPSSSRRQLITRPCSWKFRAKYRGNVSRYEGIWVVPM
jgi:hypothetical protein